MKVWQAYRFALDLTPAGARDCRSHAGASRFAWNWALAKCLERYEVEGRWFSAAELHKLWNAEKRADPALAWWSENSKCAYQEAFRDLDQALRDFIKSKKGKPSLKLSERTFTCQACGLVMDRDENAARNLLKLALAASGAVSLNACEGTVRPGLAGHAPVKQEPGTAEAGKTGTASR